LLRRDVAEVCVCGVDGGCQVARSRVGGWCCRGRCGSGGSGGGGPRGCSFVRSSPLTLDTRPLDERRTIAQPFRARGAEDLLHWFEVDGCQSADVEAQLFERVGLEFLAFGCDRGLFAHYNLLGGRRVGGQQTPVHVPPVAQVRVVGVLGAPFQDLGHQFLALGGTLDEQFDGGGEERELHFDGLVVEGDEVVLQQLVRVFDAVGVLTDDPDDGGFGLGLVELVDVLDHRADNAFVLVGVFAEDVADDHGGFLDDVRDFGVDELEERVDTLSRGGFDFDGEFADGADSFADKVDVDLGCISRQLARTMYKMR
jgi:hypothetical protein